MSATPMRKVTYRACEMPARLGIGKTKFFAMLKAEEIPAPSVMGVRARTWGEEQIQEFLDSRRTYR